MKNSMKVPIALLAAVLLLPPPAGAAKTAKLDSEARRLMSEGLAQLEAGHNTAAITTFNKAARRQGTVSSYFLLGWAHYQRGFKRGAVETADRDDAQSAIDAYGMALALDPSLSELTDPSRLHFSMALCLEAVDELDRALASYKAALRAAPDKAMIPLHAARLRLKMGDREKAEANVQMALSKARAAGQGEELAAAVRSDAALAPLLSDAATRRALGVADADRDGAMVASLDVRGEEMRDAVSDAPRPAPAAQDPAVLEKVSQGDLELKFRRWHAAVSFYEEALALDAARATLTSAQAAEVHEKLGASYNKLGRTQEAVEELRKSLQIDPMNAGAHYQIALAYAGSGEPSSALRALKEGLGAAATPAELRRLTLNAKTDPELDAVRDMPGFDRLMADAADRVARR